MAIPRAWSEQKVYFISGLAEGEGLNFAVSAEDINAVMRSQGSGPPSAKVFQDRVCEPARLYEGRNQANNGDLTQMDIDCNGDTDVTILVPDDQGAGVQALIDKNSDGEIDIVVEDTNRDGKWDVSYHDVNSDGLIDLVGYHPDGKITPSRFEKYAAR